MDVQALQHEGEIKTLCDIIRREGVQSYLEIGSKFGGSLWRVANAMPKGSRIVSVDLPSGTKVWPQSKKSLTDCVNELNRRGYDARIIWGDSTAPEVIEQVTALGPFDAALIDGNHTLPFVTKDFANYGPLCRLVAFHDIAWKRDPDWSGYPIHVPEFWASVRDQYKHEEIVLDPTGNNNGIGVLWRS